MSIARVCYALSQALNQTAATATDLQQWQAISVVCGALAGLANGYTAYHFQGKSIDAPSKALFERQPLLAPMQLPDTVIQIESINSSAIADVQHHSCKYLMAELGLNTVSVAFNLSNRYFLVSNLFLYTGMVPVAAIIWPIITCDVIFMSLFQLTNELYETNVELRHQIDGVVAAKPVYAQWRLFQVIAHSPFLRYFFAIVGSLEHAIVDDILPWLFFIPENVWSYLATGYKLWEYANIVQRSLAILVPTVGGLLALLIVLQTLFFEGEHSFEAYRSITNNPHLSSIAQYIRLPSSLKKLFALGLNLMPACHGIAAAAPVYIYFQNIFNLNAKALFVDATLETIIKSLGLLLLSIFTFLSTALGNYHSEVKEAKEILLEEITVQR